MGGSGPEHADWALITFTQEPRRLRVVLAKLLSVAALGTIDYWFVAEGRRIHKTVHHHLIRYDHGDLCDEDPEITEVAWVPFDDLPRRLQELGAARQRIEALGRQILPGADPGDLPDLVQVEREYGTGALLVADDVGNVIWRVSAASSAPTSS